MVDIIIRINKIFYIISDSFVETFSGTFDEKDKFFLLIINILLLSLDIFLQIILLAFLTYCI